MKKKRTLNQTSFLLLITILLFFVMYAVGCVVFKDQGFAKIQNFLNLFISNAGLIVISIGMTVVMITGGIDISVGSFVAMGCMMLAWMMEQAGIGAVPAVLIVLATGVVFGLVQGFLVAYMDIQPFIVTLAGMFFAKGMTTIVSKEPVRGRLVQPLWKSVWRFLRKLDIVLPENPPPLCKCTTFSVSIPLLRDIWVLSSFWLL